MVKQAKAEIARQPNRYARIIEHIFRSKHAGGAEAIAFTRAEFEDTARLLDINLPKNLGDILYSFKFRAALPVSVQRAAPAGRQWVIVNAGRGKYRFELRADTVILPSKMLAVTKVPDATPGLFTRYALNDEQALLTKLRYNRLVDIFTGAACYTLQNHLRTTVPEMGQVETDELYVGVDKRGATTSSRFRQKAGETGSG